MPGQGPSTDELAVLRRLHPPTDEKRYRYFRGLLHEKTKTALGLGLA